MNRQDSSDPALELNYSMWLPQDRRAAILDLGCGDGRMLRFLSTKGYLNIHGVDRDPVALALAGKLAGVTTECAEVGLEYLRQQRGKFKLVILKQMIYYVERSEIMSFMLALKEVLADDGVIIVEFFNAALLSSRLTELKDPFIRTAYTEHSMRRIFCATGLHELHIGGERRESGKFRSRVYAALRACWVSLLKVIYILERGIDNELPRIYTKSIIAVASISSSDSSPIAQAGELPRTDLPPSGA